MSDRYNIEICGMQDGKPKQVRRFYRTDHDSRYDIDFLFQEYTGNLDVDSVVTAWDKHFGDSSDWAPLAWLDGLTRLHVGEEGIERLDYDIVEGSKKMIYQPKEKS